MPFWIEFGLTHFRYRPIELYEVIIPNTEVVIGKERDPTEWYDDVEKFSKR